MTTARKSTHRTTPAGTPASNALVAMWHARIPAVALVTWLCAGCPASGDEVAPDPDRFYFPTGLELSPDESVLFVASSNSDLRYDSGAVHVVGVAHVEDLVSVDDLLDEWQGGAGSEPPGCARDVTVPYTLVCDDEGDVIRSKASVRIGNFATDLRVQTLDSGALRLFLAVRGDPSLTWIDYVDGKLSCGDEGGFPECDEDHRLSQMRNLPELGAIQDEPFGAVGVAGRLPGSANDRIYVTSRVESRVQTLIVNRPERGFPTLVPTEFFFMNRAVATSTGGRGITFSDDGSRAYIVNRVPPMLHIFDTSMDALGVPRNEFVAGVELCSQASNLTVARTVRGDRVYVACFGNGQIWVINPDGAE